MKLLLVSWRDAASHHIGWASLSDIAKIKAPIAQSVGWEVTRDLTQLVICSSLVDDEGSLTTVIPLGMIVSEELLR